MMNWEDENYPELEEKMKNLSKKAIGLEELKENHMSDINDEYISVCQKILRREWARLKNDLKKKRV